MRSGLGCNKRDILYVTQGLFKTYRKALRLCAGWMERQKEGEDFLTDAGSREEYLRVTTED